MRKAIPVLVTLAVATAIACAIGAPAPGASTVLQEWQKEFNISQRALADIGESDFFILRPGYQLLLEGGGETVTVTVLDQVREIDGITTRVVEERSEVRGKLVELAMNYFAIDPATRDVFYLGEDVDIYDGDVVTHEGSWLAYRDGNPGLIMPGRPEVGMRYYQEVAPGIAEDRAEVLSTSARVSTPAGTFENCLVTAESSELEPGGLEQKSYAPGIGLVQSGSLRLVSYGYVDTVGRREAR